MKTEVERVCSYCTFDVVKFSGACAILHRLKFSVSAAHRRRQASGPLPDVRNKTLACLACVSQRVPTRT